LVIRFTSEPAYRTLTEPDPVGEEEAEAEAEAAAEVADELAAAAVELDELDEELQPAAASPIKARPTTTNRARADRYVGMLSTIATVTCGTQ
jgi:hypothetical protein